MHMYLYKLQNYRKFIIDSALDMYTNYPELLWLSGLSNVVLYLQMEQFLEYNNLFI